LSWTGHELAISVCKDQRFIYCVHLSGRFAPQPGQPIFAQPIFTSAIAPARAHHPRRFQCPEPRSFHSGRGLNFPQRATPAAAARHACGA
jgi:hypothetical protein